MKPTITISALLTALLPSLAFATDRSWDGTTGNWNVSANWTADTLPNSSDNAHIDNGGTAQLPATVSGAYNELRIGFNPGTSGTISLSGGSLSGTRSFLGYDATGTGSATVTGGTWDNSVVLDIGLNGTGTLTINGGTVSNSIAEIGRNSGSHGTVTVTSGTWTNSAQLYVGRTGTGTLTINGGAVSADTGIIGNTGSGTATVSSGSWTISNTLTIGNGNAGTGSLEITGGQVSSATTHLAELGGSNGTLTLGGGTLQTGQVVKGAGTGSLVLDGGTLRATGVQSNFLSGFTGGDVTIDAGGAVIDSNGHAIGINLSLGGGTLTKLGGGTLSLNAANSFTGVTVQAGTLLANVADALPGAVPYVVNGGTLDLGGLSLSVSSLSGAGGTIDIDGNFVVNQSAADTTFGGAITSDSDADFYKMGSKQLTLAGGMPAGGNIQASVQGGSLVFNNASTLKGVHAGNLGTTGAVTIASGSLTATQYLTVGEDAGGTGTLTIGSGGTLTLGAGAILTVGYSGGTGTLDIQSGGKLEVGGADGLDTDGALSSTVNFGGTIKVVDSNLTTSLPMTVSTSTAAVDTNSLDATFSGALTGVGGLAKQGAGTLTLTGTNTWSGGTTVAAGTLVRGTAGAFVDSSPYTVNGGTLDLADTSLTMTSLSGSGGTVALGTGTLTVSQPSDTAFAGVITGTGGLIKQGAGTLTLTGVNTYTGATTIDAGAVQIGDGTTNGSIAGNITTNSTVVFNNPGPSTYAGAITGTGALVKAGAGTLTLTGNSSYANGTSINAGTLVVSGSGAVLDNSPSFIFLGQNPGDNGSLEILNGGQVMAYQPRIGEVAGSTGSVTVTNGALHTDLLYVGVNGTGSLLVNGGTVTSNGATIGSIGSGTVTVSSGSWNVVNAITVGLSGPATLTISGGLVSSATVRPALNWPATGTINLTGGVLETGRILRGSGGAVSVVFDGGTLRASSGHSDFLAVGDGATTINAGGAFINSNGQDIGIAVTMGGSGGLTKLGAGKLSLSGGNTYTGPTTVSAGTLELLTFFTLDSSSGIAVASGATLQNSGFFPVTIGAGRTLSGAGSITGPIAVGGTLAPGDGAIGTLTAETLTWNAGGHFVFGLGATTSDLLDVGTFTKGGTGAYVFDFLSAGWQQGQTYTLIDFDTTDFLAGDFSFGNVGGFDGTFAFNGTSLQFTLVAIPEPSTYGLALIGLLVGLSTLRIRRKGTSASAAPVPKTGE